MNGGSVYFLDLITAYDAPFWDAAQPRGEIDITLPDGSVKKGTSWETSPLDIAKQLSKSLADRVVISKVRCACVSVTLACSSYFISFATPL